VSQRSGPRVTASNVIYRSEALDLRVDTVVIGEGQTAQRHVVEYRPACAAVIHDLDREAVLLVRHYRHPVRRRLWEIPGGIIEAAETPEEAASREVSEETGIAIRDIRPLLTFHPEPAFTDHRITLVEASADKDVKISSPDEHEIDRIRWVPYIEVDALIHKGEITSSWSLLGLMTSLGRAVNG
jgi:8-oxo-dGDP phosphatase